MSWLSILAGLFKLFNGFMSMFRDNQLREDGAARQRDKDFQDESSKVLDAARAADNVRSGIGVSTKIDPYDREPK